MKFSRRHALKLILAGSLTPLMPTLWSATAAANSAPLRPVCSGQLSMVNLHTRETLTCRYLTENGEFIPAALNKLDHLFRCRYTGRVRAISPELFILMDAVRTHLKAQDRPFHLISGYRSPKFNAILSSRNQKVARKSYHLKGMAADFRIEGVKLSDIRKTATRLKAGGVGHYRSFVHLDVGPVRYW